MMNEVDIFLERVQMISELVQGRKLDRLFKRIVLITVTGISLLIPRVSRANIPGINDIRANISCQGLGVPITKTQLEQMFADLNNAGGSLFAATPELSFERFAIGAYPLAVDYRQNEFSSILGRSVMPDGIGDSGVTITNTEGEIIYDRNWPDSAFFDAKTDRASLGLRSGSTENQIIGFIDVTANNTPAGTEGETLPVGIRPTPSLSFFTVKDTVLRREVGDFARELNVAIYQHFACERGSGVLGVDNLVMGRGVGINLNFLGAPGQPDPEVFTPSGNPGSIGRLPVAVDPPDPYD